MNYFLPLEANGVYHIFNHANGWDDFYYDKQNCDYFLKKMQFHLWPVLSVCAYNLLFNHFHLVVRIRTESEIIRCSKQWCRHHRVSYRPLKPAQQFSNFFNGYTKAMNKVYERKGSLFQRQFKRILVDNEDYLRYVIAYVHTNAQKHDLVDDYKKWEFSSYHKILSDKPTYLLKEKVLALYNGEQNYINYHEKFLYERNVASSKYDNFTGR